MTNSACPKTKYDIFQGAVTVYASLIANVDNTVKTYVVTCHTTANQLRDMVLDAYNVISPIKEGFYIELETCSGE